MFVINNEVVIHYFIMMILIHCKVVTLHRCPVSTTFVANLINPRFPFLLYFLQSRTIQVTSKFNFALRISDVILTWGYILKNYLWYVWIIKLIDHNHSKCHQNSATNTSPKTSLSLHIFTSNIFCLSSNRYVWHWSWRKVDAIVTIL